MPPPVPDRLERGVHPLPVRASRNLPAGSPAAQRLRSGPSSDPTVTPFPDHPARPPGPSPEGGREEPGGESDGGPLVGRQDPDVSATLLRLRRGADYLDAAFRIPGTRIRLGWDSLLGVIPGAGDLLGATAALWIVAEGILMRAPASVVLRMLWNVAIDALVGAIPLVGDLFDVAWKANLRNVALLERAAADPQRTDRRSRLLLWGIAGGLFLVVALVAAAVLAVLRALLGVG